MRYVATLVTMVGTLASVFLSTGRVGAQEITVDDVVRMWSERQSMAETAEFRWRETVARPVNQLGLRGVRLPHPDGTNEVDGQRVPLNQALTVEEHEVILRLGDGLNIRAESIPVANLDESVDSLTHPGLSVSAFNGKRNVYYTAAVGPNDHHRGIEFDADIYDEIVNFHLRAVLLCYRPLLVARSSFSHVGGSIVQNQTTLRIVNRDAVLNGHRCLILESAPNGATTNRYWVDVARNGLILRHVEVAAGRTTLDLTVSYADSEQHGWVPTAWHANFRDGNSKVDARVVDFAINEPIAADDFQVVYPTGTVIFDRDQGKQWRILADGTREPVTL